MSMIEFQNISKKYKSQNVIDDLSMKIERGEFAVFIGPSGSGKTTLLKMINRLINPTSGQIKINGENIATQDIIKLRRNMGYVIQQTGLFPHLTIKQNIELIEKLEKFPKDEVDEKTLHLLDVVGLPRDYIDRYPTQLSGGQQQRVGVARALASDPDVILMDEPFSALDPITRGQLQDELIQLQSELQKTIVFVTHDMDEAIKLADKICILHNGNIAQFDSPEEILKNPADDFVRDFVGKNRIWAAPEFIHAEDIMIENPIYTKPSTSIFRCIEMMRTKRVDSVLVANSKGVLEGAVYSSSIHKYSDNKRPVSEIMKTNIATAKREDSIIDILQLINQNNISNIPVVEDDGKLCGLITRSSLVNALSQQYLATEEEEAE